MDRTSFLEWVKARVNQRPNDYGSPEDNFQTIAAFWNVYLLNKFGPPADCSVLIEPVDVALMMDLLKTARLIKTPNHFDSWADKGGYSACGAEVSNA